MIDWSFSLTPFLAVALGNFFFSWLYYSPMSPFFKAWSRGLGLDPNNRTMSEDQKKAMPRLMGGAVVATVLFAYGLQVVVNSLGLTTFTDGMMAGFVVWFAFAVSHSLNTQFEGRKPIILVINDFWFLLTYVGFGGLLAVWK
ncbi:MAG: DUF1761 domain-containing protein [Candidatus Kerfeldbacteria bacterium]|nr:DUF1761 domain-containing protein [Candidatus Kerfeldbacteria bacterium]